MPRLRGFGIVISARKLLNSNRLVHGTNSIFDTKFLTLLQIWWA